MSEGVIVRWRGVKNRPGAQVANSCKNSTCASSDTSTSNEPWRRATALQSRPWWRKTNNINDLVCLSEGHLMQLNFQNGWFSASFLTGGWMSGYWQEHCEIHAQELHAGNFRTVCGWYAHARNSGCTRWSRKANMPWLRLYEYKNGVSRQDKINTCT